VRFALRSSAAQLVIHRVRKVWFRFRFRFRFVGRNRFLRVVILASSLQGNADDDQIEYGPSDLSAQSDASMAAVAPWSRSSMAGLTR
jgi:hypothetical protein